MPDYYFTIEKASQAEFKDRGSKFIAYAFPISDVKMFEEKLAEIKKQHPKATHHCFAYRIGMDSNNFRANDDGEPSGSAGRPILGQIDSKQLTNVLVIVVRYFGGTQLGIPGLINSYKTVTAMALNLTPIVQKPVVIGYRLEFDYTLMNDVMRIVKQFDCSIDKQDMELFCRVELGIPRNKLKEALSKLHELHSIDLKAID